MEIIETYSLLILQSFIALLLWMILRLILKKIVLKRLRLTDFSEVRKKITLKSVFAVLNILVAGVLVSIWSVDQKEILIFLSSMVTVLGVAFFAQWSHLSNITSGIIVFFNTSTKIGDEIKILDKDFEIEGEMLDIGMMFFKIRTAENEIISLPNNIVLQKAIKTSFKKNKSFPVQPTVDLLKKNSFREEQ
jgi:small-conductance mechanosensitive channel